MVQTVLLTLGRLPKALALARALKGQGCRVIIAEPFPRHVCRPSRHVDLNLTVPKPNADPEAYQRAVADIVTTHGVDLVVPVSEEIHHVLALRETLPGVRVLGPEAAVARDLQDKWSFIERAARLGLNAPATRLQTDAAATALARRCDYVTKPRMGCSGIGVEYHEAGSSVIGLPEDTLVQQKIQGRPLSSLSVLEAGVLKGTVVYEGRVFSDTVAVCFECVTNAPQVEAWIEAFTDSLNFTGFIAFDFIVDPDGEPWPLECNPRLTSGIHFMDLAGIGEWMVKGTTDRNVITANPPKQQWAYSTLTEAWAAVLSGDFSRARAILGELLSARDVVWDARDPLPFLLMTPMSWDILWPAITEGISLGEASQRDIAALFKPETVDRASNVIQLYARRRA